MNNIARADFETRSKIDLLELGAYRYAFDETTSVLCLSWKLPDGTKGFWHKWCNEQPVSLFKYIVEGGKVESHNAEFEHCIWNYYCVPALGWPPLPIEQQICSAAQSAALALPRKLEKLVEALGCEIKKDMVGHRVMQRLSKPRKPTKAEKDARLGDELLWHEDIESLERLFEYNDVDVAAEEGVSVELEKFPLSEKEQKVWEFTVKVNKRGIFVDTELCKIAVEFLTRYGHELTSELKEVSGGALYSANQHARIKEFVNERGVHIDDTQAATIEEVLKDDFIDLTARRVLEIRQALGRSSVTKFQKMIDTACPDGRVRGTLLYHGATTGRYSGRLIQPQNFAKPKPGTNVAGILYALSWGDYGLFKDIYPNVLEALSACLRGMLRAAPGHRLMSGDFSGIEARVVLWLAGDMENLKELYLGVDSYKTMAALIYGVPVSQVTKTMRELGKRAVLGCGFGMGPDKFFLTCEQQGFPITMELAKKAVAAYREKYYMVRNYWYDLNRQCMAAVESPGRLVKFRNLQILKKGRFLLIRLPSGRKLSYPDPEIHQVVKSWGPQDSLTFMEQDKNQRWVRGETYGGKLTENVTQAVARDIMVDSMLRLEDAGYPVIFTVHDENVCEVPKGFGSEAEFKEIMEVLEPWAEGVPIKVETWEAERYKK